MTDNRLYSNTECSQCGHPEYSVDSFGANSRLKRVAVCHNFFWAYWAHQTSETIETPGRTWQIHLKMCYRNRFSKNVFWAFLRWKTQREFSRSETSRISLLWRCHDFHSRFWRSECPNLWEKSNLCFFSTSKSALSEPIFDLTFFPWNFRIIWSLGWKEKQEHFHPYPSEWRKYHVLGHKLMDFCTVIVSICNGWVQDS